MKVIVTSATAGEWKRIQANLSSRFYEADTPMQVAFHTSGVGMLITAVSLSTLITQHRPAIIIQAGIAGAFSKNVLIGDVVAVKEEYLGDTGVEEKGVFNDVFDMQLMDDDTFPFTQKNLTNHWLQTYNLLQLSEVTAVTINEITTRPERIKQLSSKYDPAIESMEGAALHYTCLSHGVPFIQLRAISNYAGERDKSKWNIPLALERLQKTVLNYMDALVLQ